MEPVSLSGDLAALGLQVEENLTPSDIQQRYFQGRNDNCRACEHAHLVCALVNKEP